MTFAELVAAMQARDGLRVKLTSEDPTRARKRRRTSQGIVKPGLDDRAKLAPDNDGRLVFRLAPFEWYALDPGVVTDAREEADGRRLRVEMGRTTWVIETLSTSAID
jgi:hypothetical protein